METQWQFQKGKKTLFDSQRIAAYVAEGYIRDLSTLKNQAYCVDTPEKLLVCENSLKVLKKFKRPGKGSDRTERRAYDKFYETLDHLRGVSPVSACRGPTLRHTPPLNRTLYRAKQLIRQVLGDFSLESWYSECRHSSGSSRGVSFVDTSLEAKWGFPLSATSRVKNLFDDYTRYDGELLDALCALNGKPFTPEMLEIVQGSRACTVPKDNEVDRMIAVEPTLNMFFQQGLMTLMYERLALFGLPVWQLPNTHTFLAFSSSITGLLATIDWSSASDCVSEWLVRELFPRDWWWAMDIVRSPSVEIEGLTLDAVMYASMGNATTFPVETLVFWALAEAVTMEGNTVWRESSDFQCSVFGDDCIVPSRYAADFIEVCTDLGFLVNSEKSFLEGPFRESCGGDYYRGTDVRPFYLKGPVSETRGGIEAMLYIWLNGVTAKYKKYFGTLSYLYDKTAYNRIFEIFVEIGIEPKFVPSFYPDDSGFHCEDLARFCANYSLGAPGISKDRHGSVSFHFLSFRYKGKKRSRCEELRLATWKKFSSITSKRVSECTFLVPPDRKLGGYVTGKGITGHWPVTAAVPRLPNEMLNT